MYNDHTTAQTDILIVDDDATIRLLMQEALSDECYKVIDVSNGMDALAQIKARQPDLVLLDVTMPGMDGFEVCRKIRQQYGNADISIIMVTALEDSESIERSYESGATDFISKPINWDTFPYRIQYLIKARNAIIEIQQQQLHLEYMEHVSRIITQNKDKETILQETMLAMLDIFSADRAILLKPAESQENTFEVDFETANDGNTLYLDLDIAVADALEKEVLDRACASEYPLLSHYDPSRPPPSHNATLRQQMISALHLKHAQNWFLIIQQNSRRPNWTITDEETFYKISLRLANMLSRQLLTEDLSRSEALLKQAQKISRIGSWNWNPGSRIMSWSDEVYTIYGRSRRDYTPDFEKHYEVSFEEDEERLQLLKRIEDASSSSYKIDHRIRTPDNIVKWTHEECIGIYDKAGRLLEINGVVQDITEARNKKEQEVHNNKMEAIGQLTSGIAHDFGNLMTVARGNLELLDESLAKNLAPDNEEQELLADTLSAVNDSVELTRQLLFFSRKKSIAPVAVDVAQTLKRFSTLFSKTLGERVEMSLQISDGLPDILVNPSQFESSLLNIVINARNAMPEGGRLEITTGIMTPTQADETISHSDDDLGDECIHITLTDNGTGMSGTVLSRAIEPFYTTQVNQGTGLGLSMVYGFMQQSEGRLVLRSQPGEGTSITLLFPIHRGLTADQQGQNKIPTLQLPPATILIVEDRHAVRQYAARCLNQPGITILQAEDATSAQELLRSHDIDLLFTDIIMPGDMDGYALAAWARQEYPELKILLTSAMEKIGSGTRQDAADDDRKPTLTDDIQLLSKPYSKDELIEHVSKLFDTVTS